MRYILIAVMCMVGLRADAQLIFSSSQRRPVVEAAGTTGDTNVYLIYMNMTTNGALLEDVSGNNRDMAILPSVAGGAAQFLVTNSPVKYAYTFDGVDSRFRLDALTGMTNSGVGTIHLWQQRTTIPIDNASYGEVLLAIDTYDSATLWNLTIGHIRLGNGNTNVAMVQATVGGALKWSFYTGANTIGINEGWQLMSIVQNGTSPVIYLNGILTTVGFTDSTDTTVWTDSFVAKSYTLGGISYNNAIYDVFAEDMAVYAQLDYAQASNQVYEYWQLSSPTNYGGIE